MGISFTKRLRPAIRQGDVTVSVRFWHSPRVKAGERYPMDGGAVAVTEVRQIQLEDITQDLAIQSGFTDVEDMLAIAKHGRSELIWLVSFVFEPAGLDLL